MSTLLNLSREVGPWASTAGSAKPMRPCSLARHPVRAARVPTAAAIVGPSSSLRTPAVCRPLSVSSLRLPCWKLLGTFLHLWGAVGAREKRAPTWGNTQEWGCSWATE